MAADKQPGISLLTNDRISQAFEKTCEEFVPARGRFVLLTDKYYDAAIEFGDVCFSKDEPISRSLGVRWNCPGARNFWNGTLAQHISPALVDEQTDEIMAARFVRWEPKNAESAIERDDNDPALNKFVDFWEMYGAEAKFDEHFTYEEVYHFFGLATSPKYRGQGYATQLMEFTLQFLRHLDLPNCRLINTDASSNYSQKIFEKFGFQCIHTKMYADYKVNGETVLNDTGEHTCMKTYGLYI